MGKAARLSGRHRWVREGLVMHEPVPPESGIGFPFSPPRAVCAGARYTRAGPISLHWTSARQ